MQLPMFAGKSIELWPGHGDQVFHVKYDLHQVSFGTKQFSIVRGVHAAESYEKPEQYE